MKAFDAGLNRFVAVKVIASVLAGSGAARKRFAREARAAAAVVHEHVVAVHAVDETAGLPYLVMEYVAGCALQDRLDKNGPLALKEILRIGMQAAAGLAAAHAQGLVHRDIKPANILLENGVERVKLTDFGLARAVADASLTQSGVIAGTPHYMAPEQARGDAIDHRADLFSLGSTLYAMCTGHPPFRAETPLAVLRRVTDDNPRPVRESNADVPAWVEVILGKLMAKDPAARIQTAAEAAELLEKCLAHVHQPQSVPLPSILGLDRPVRRWLRPVIVAGALAASAGVILTLSLSAGPAGPAGPNLGGDAPPAAGTPLVAEDPVRSAGSTKKAEAIEQELAAIRERAAAVEADVLGWSMGRPSAANPIDREIAQTAERVRILEMELTPPGTRK
jgi:serine/threonine-protein kinase